MKTLAIIIMLVALFLLYKIACQKPVSLPKTTEDLPEKEPETTESIVGKSAFVRSARSQSTPNADSPLNAENQTKKAYIFAPANEQNIAVIPLEELNEVFEDISDLDIPPDDETDEIDIDEEAEALFQTTRDDELASGFTYEEMAAAINNPSDEKAEMLYQIEPTDLFEQLVSNNEAKALRIKTVIDRHIQNLQSEKPENNSEYGDFDIADYLS